MLEFEILRPPPGRQCTHTNTVEIWPVSVLYDTIRDARLRVYSRFGLYQSDPDY